MNPGTRVYVTKIGAEQLGLPMGLEGRVQKFNLDMPLSTWVLFEGHTEERRVLIWNVGILHDQKQYDHIRDFLVGEQVYLTVPGAERSFLPLGEPARIVLLKNTVVWIRFDSKMRQGPLNWRQVSTWDLCRDPDLIHGVSVPKSRFSHILGDD